MSYRILFGLVIVAIIVLGYLYLGESSDISSSSGTEICADNDIYMKAYFCPEDGCAQAVVNEINMAEKHIEMAAYSFTHENIAEALVQASKRNVTITVILDEQQAGMESSKKDYLSLNGIDCILDKNPKLMHNKFWVIDNITLITGSFNPTTNADKYNDENLLVIKNSALAKQYDAEFWEMYEQYK